MERIEHPRVVVVALPLAYQDGMDKYNGIMRYLRESGVCWELRILRDAFGAARIAKCVAQNVAGVICGTYGCSDGDCGDVRIHAECLKLCRRMKIPLVGLDWPPGDFQRSDLRRCSFLNIDSEQIGMFAAQTVLNAGNYAAYGFVGMFPDCAWSRDRGAFFAKGIRRAGGRSVRIFKGDPFGSHDDLRRWLSSLPRPTAVFAANDSAADAVLKACQRGALRVPEDFSVLGVDDDPVFCVHMRLTLSSIHPDFTEIGYQAARVLDRMMFGGGGGERIVTGGVPTVTSRMSTAPCSPAGMLVRRIDEIIAARACQNIDSNLIADELKISRRLLDLRYRQMTGRSVREAIVKARISRAKHLLAYSGHSIGTISSLCGYRTESYLGKLFLEQEGMSMGEYRASLAKNTRREGK